MGPHKRQSYIYILDDDPATFREPHSREDRLHIIMDGDQGPLASARRDALLIRAFLNNQRQGWEAHLTLGRSIITRLDSLSAFHRSNNFGERVWFVDTLQRLAYFDPDSGGAQDIAGWCNNRWLQILQEDGDNVGALQGKGPSRSSIVPSSLEHNTNDDRTWACMAFPSPTMSR